MIVLTNVLCGTSSSAQELQMYECEVGAFQLKLPNEPEFLAIDMGDGKIQHQHYSEGDEGSIIVWYLDVDNDNTDAVLKSVCDSYAKTSGGEVIVNKELKVRSFTERYLHVKVLEPAGQARCLTSVVNGRLYTIFIAGSETFANSETVDEIFKSFEVTEVNRNDKIHGAKESVMKLKKD